MVNRDTMGVSSASEAGVGMARKAGKGFFATRLREVRLGAGLSQGVLAKRSGVAVSTVRQFEYGLREPAYGTLVKLARGLGVSLAAFDPEEVGGATGQAAKKGGGTRHE
jgi:ribosome-binding protein aMBF1 (putative translation factor)